MSKGDIEMDRVEVEIIKDSIPCYTVNCDSMGIYESFDTIEQAEAFAKTIT